MQFNLQSRSADRKRSSCAAFLLLAWMGTCCAHSQQAGPATVVADSVPANYVPATAQVQGTPLDRVVAMVNGDIILDSDLDQEARFEGLHLNSQQIGPPAAAPEQRTRAEILERLINRDLILQQVRLEPHERIGDDAVDKEIAEVRNSLPACAQFDCKTDAGWQRYLASIQFTEGSFRERWRERMEVLAFTEQRFRMGIRITGDQEKSYYDKTLLPEYSAAKVKAPPFDSIATRIQAVLVEQQVSALIGDWLKSLRAQGSVIVLHPGEQAP
jgi:hypothetical protein